MYVYRHIASSDKDMACTKNVLNFKFSSFLLHPILYGTSIFLYYIEKREVIFILPLEMRHYIFFVLFLLEITPSRAEKLTDPQKHTLT